MQRLIVSALVALALLPFGEARSEWLQKSKNDLNNAERREMLQRWRDLRWELKRTSLRHVKWGKEKQANRWNTVTLAPVYKTSSRRKVEVEWFFTYIGESAQIEPLLAEWAASLREGTNDRVRLKLSPVAVMPGRSKQFNDYHATHQLLAFAAEAMGEKRKIHQKMRKLISEIKRSLRTETEVETFLGAIGVSVADFREAAASDRVRRRVRETNAKIEDISARAKEVHKHALREPRDPVLLINGKYLVQGSTAGGVRRALRVANGLIRRELEGRRR